MNVGIHGSYLSRCVRHGYVRDLVSSVAQKSARRTLLLTETQVKAKGRAGEEKEGMALLDGRLGSSSIRCGSRAGCAFPRLGNLSRSRTVIADGASGRQ